MQELKAHKYLFPRITKYLMPALSMRKLQRYLLPAMALGFILLWLILAAMLWSHWRIEQAQIQRVIHQEAELALTSKAAEIEVILQQTYHMARTISLLPGIRSTRPGNRLSDTEDIIASGRMSAADYDTVQQLYNHIASLVAVSEIYIIYDGFNPELGQVPFVMFDQIIVDRFAELAPGHDDVNNLDLPEEYESEEYADYVRQLDYFRRHSFSMPGQSLEDIHPINSGTLRTCDNTQYLSKSRGDVRNTHGFTISVPIYDLVTRQFKGLVTAILRNNVLEATLVGWPVLPVTKADRDLLDNIRGIDLNSPPVNYLLQEQTFGIEISDRRHRDFAQIRNSAAYHFEVNLKLPGPGNWVLHNYVPQAAINAATRGARHQALLQIASLSLVLLLLWASVHMVLKSQRKAALQLRQLAEVDPLTGLPNRRMIGMYMNAILSSTDQQQYFAVIMIDLDDFKQVNDSLGHEAGDRMLIEIAHRFNRVLRDEDQVLRIASLGEDSDQTELTISRVERAIGRLGGDEFLVILGHLDDKGAASIVARRLLASLSDAIEIGLERIYARVSMGIAVYPDDGADAASLLQNADIALYEAKRRGRDQTVIFEPEMDADAIRRLKITAGLHEALHKEQFFLVYQPELCLESGTINAAEALVRWRHPEFGLVMPYEFIPLLERSGLIIEVGQWILETACRQFKLWGEMGLQIQSISVNISPKQLAQEDFVDLVSSTLAKTGVKPTELVLEVTESLFIENAEIAISSLAAVRRLAVRVAIDDFGTGYSSLSYLRNIPLDILKIDRSFVVATDTDNGIAICDMLIELARRLGLEVVAEGIETQQQLDIMQHADWIQGYFIARPLESGDFVAKVNEYTIPIRPGFDRVAR